MNPVLLLQVALLLGAPPEERRPFDAPIPPQPPVDPSAEVSFRDARALGTPTTIFVNFDGVELGRCNPSNSKKNCHWYNNDEPFEPFSGSLQTKVAVLQAMRQRAAEYGVRITAVRPSDDEDYTMVVYGGTEEEFGALGSAPSGDCLDQRPNQIVFAHLEGQTADWVNGGATTALHEAAHSWGLDHIDTEQKIMFPAGNNAPAFFADGCQAVVQDVELTPGKASCPELALELCENDGTQDADAVLRMLFGPPYVDTQAPRLELLEPEDGQYFQAPAEFAIRLGIDDDLHPQAYDVYAWIGDDPRPERPSKLVDPRLLVEDLPEGSWTFHLAVLDEAGNESRLDFDVEVGLDPPPTPNEGCGCSSAPSGPGTGTPAWLLLALCIGSNLGRRTRS